MSDRGVRRHGRFGGVWTTTPYANPSRPPKLAFAPWSARPSSLPLRCASIVGRARRKPRKDAGNTRGASTRSRSSGKQTLVETHRARAPRTAARQVGRGWASPSQAVLSADAEWRRLSRERESREGRSGVAPKARVLAAEAPGNRGPSETVRGRHARTSQGRHDSRLCQALWSVGSVRLKGHMALRRQAGNSKQRKAPWVVPPSSRQGRWLLHARGRWDDSGLSVKPNLVRSREAHGGGAGARELEPDALVPGDDMGRQRSGRISWRLYQRRYEKRARGGSALRTPRGVAAHEQRGFGQDDVQARGQRVRERRIGWSGR